MKKQLALLLIIFIGFRGFSQDEKEIPIVYYGLDKFLIEGSKVPVSEKISPYDRMPADYKDKVREPVWNLSRNSAGMSVRFNTNSSRIKVEWTLLNNSSMNHMAGTGIRGVDLYFINNGIWQYVNTGIPGGQENSSLLISNMSREMREYRLYLPLYDGVTDLKIGVDSLADFTKGQAPEKRPIVFYGTSITQGGCASRPGMVHTSIISRALNRECINFGFSGNGKMEREVGELISEIDAEIFIIDCLPNMTAEQVEERTIPMVELLKEKWPDTPVVLVENLIYEKAFLDGDNRSLIEGKNRALKNQYEILLDKGVKNIFYMDNSGAMAGSHEGTVDGVHFTDLGFKYFADYFLEKFKEFKLISD